MKSDSVTFSFSAVSLQSECYVFYFSSNLVVHSSDHAFPFSIFSQINSPGPFTIYIVSLDFITSKIIGEL